MEEITQLLTSPFVLAETVVCICLDEAKHSHLTPTVRELSENAQAGFLARVVGTDDKIDPTAISTSLNIELWKFHADFYALFPGSLLPSSVWNKWGESYDWLFFFPADSPVDWKQLLRFFVNVGQSLQSPLDEATEKVYIQLTFALACRHLTVEGLIYDEKIVDHYVDLLGEQIEEYCLDVQFDFLQQHDKPPLQQRLREVKEMIANYREQVVHIPKFKIPPFGKRGDKLRVPTTVYVDAINNLTELYEAKKERLQATIEREDGDMEQATERTSVTLPTPDYETKISSGFENHLFEQPRVKLMPFLKQNYTNQKPEQYGFMLYALVNSGCMASTTLHDHKTNLHKALQTSFGNVGTRQNLSAAINRLDRPNDEDKRQIAAHEQLIRQHLKPNSTQ